MPVEGPFNASNTAQNITCQKLAPILAPIMVPFLTKGYGASKPKDSR